MRQAPTSTCMRCSCLPGGGSATRRLGWLPGFMRGRDRAARARVRSAGGQRAVPCVRKRPSPSSLSSLHLLVHGELQPSRAERARPAAGETRNSARSRPRDQQ
ncbi:hypothetical protein BDA96_01G429100 [Sorghum bicolor]|uniref:Uncharacterized protein n=1 Tax=Sorghum bicolor TaxID=4558 RepID=A0A921S6Q8_SORBI|nr:hypothetical protein BDA96_01G429100 [Sorghum bicolor]